MNPKKPKRILTSSIAALAAIAVFSPSSADAASGAWNVDAAGNWGTTTNWNPAAIPGTAAGDVITLGNGITAARIVTIDTTSRSAGDLNIGASTAFGFTLASSATTVVLNLDGTGTADATVDFTANANTISAPITLVDNGIFRSNIAAIQTLSGIISGAKTVTFNNDTNGTVNAATSLLGQFTVSGVNTYSLGTTISDVRVTITTSNAALGTGAVTIQAGGQVYNATGLTAIANTFNINGNGWLETLGQLGALRLEGASIVTGNVVMQSNSAIGSHTGTGAVTGTVNGIVSGGFALTKVGIGTLALGGVNTFSGGLVIGNGAVQLNNNAGAGTGTISFATGGATNATKLLVNGGVTAGNAININAAVFGVAGNGVLTQTGTGLATLNGAINITAAPTAGGHFVGGNSATNVLVLNGAITSTIQVTQRDGFVRYAGGGTGYNSFGITGTALLGATNGISTAAVTTVGLSAPGSTLDLNGFDQALPSISMGNNGASTNSGTIALGARTLTLNGDLFSLNSGAVNVTNAVTATAGGTINFGASPRNISVPDTNALDDLRITGATLAGSGLTKTGTGTLALNGATFSTPLTVSAGSLQAGTANAVGSASLSGLTFTGTTGLKMKVGAAGDSLTVTGAGGLVASGTTTVTLNQVGGALANGTYNLINYSGTSPGLTGFTLAQVGHSTSTLIDTGTAIALSVTDNAQVIWDGTSTSAWATGVTGNWKHGVTTAVTDYIESDDVIFQDGPISANPTIATNIFPSNVTFTNTTSTPYTVSGAAGIAGPTGITKSGDGTLTFSNLNTYSGATAIQAGTLILNHSTTTPLAAASAMSVSGGATVRFTHTGGVFTLVNPISGAGMVVIDPSTTAAGNRDIATVTWNTTGMTGTLRLAPTTGTMRIAVDNPTDLGGGPVEVATGGQVFLNTVSCSKQK